MSDKDQPLYLRCLTSAAKLKTDREKAAEERIKKEKLCKANAKMKRKQIECKENAATGTPK